MKLALPLPSVAEPNAVEPSMNVTELVGVPLPGAAAVTVAVNVTDCPLTRVDRRAESVEVPSWLTAWLSVGDVLVMKLPSPP